MANTIETPYMLLELPVPTVQLGPQYALDNNIAFGLIDSHNHTAGRGQLIPVAGLSIDADLSLNSFNLTTARSLRMNNNSTPLALVADVASIYVANGNLYYNNSIGQQVQLTAGASINVSNLGTIGGDYGQPGVPAIVNYFVAPNNTYYFFQDTNQYAPIATGPITVSGQGVGDSGVTIKTSGTFAGAYDLLVPDSPPTVPSVIVMDPSGQLSTTPTNLGGLLPTGGILPYAGVSIPSGYLLCDGSAVSRTTFSILFTAIATAYGVGDGSTTFNLPDLRGLFPRGVDSGAGNDPDAASRTATNGGNSGDNVGSFQSDIYGSHAHLYGTPRNTGAGGTPWVANAQAAPVIDGNYVTSAAGGSETRPKNVYVNFIIKT